MKLNFIYWSICLLSCVCMLSFSYNLPREKLGIPYYSSS